MGTAFSGLPSTYPWQGAGQGLSTNPWALQQPFQQPVTSILQSLQYAPYQLQQLLQLASVQHQQIQQLLHIVPTQLQQIQQLLQLTTQQLQQLLYAAQSQQIGHVPGLTGYPVSSPFAGGTIGAPFIPPSPISVPFSGPTHVM